MSHRSRDTLVWFVLAAILFGGVHWLGKGTALDFPQRSPAIPDELRAMTNLFCFSGGVAAILIGLRHLFTAPAEDLPGDIHERRHHHARRTGFMSILGLGFSLAATIVWYLPLNQDDRGLMDASPFLGIIFVLMTVLCGLGIGLSWRRQQLFERRRA